VNAAATLIPVDAVDSTKAVDQRTRPMSADGRPKPPIAGSVSPIIFRNTVDLVV
jgi:hypothetical protein